MPDSEFEPAFPAFQLFEDGSFLGLEKFFRRFGPALRDGRVQIAWVLLITWLPPLVLSALWHEASGRSQASFFSDAGIQARFLIALPVILFVPRKISAQLQAIVEHFEKARLVKESERERFAANITTTMKRSHSRQADWIILALIYLTRVVVLLFVAPNMPPTWRTMGPEGHRSLSPAGWWFGMVSEPFYEFVFYRFLYRVALWWSFLWKTSRLDLQLDAAHPDGSGGLGFLGLSLRAFREAAFAISASFAGGLANIVLLMGTRVSSYMSEILALVIISMGIFAGPLFFFYRLLVGMKIRDTLEYWVLWQGQLRQFEKNWMRNFAEFPDMLSVADFSEATDLSQILERVQQTRHVPMTTRQIQPLLIAAVLPFVVVMTLEYPVDEMIRQISKIAF